MNEPGNSDRRWVIYRLWGYRRRWVIFGRRRLKYVGISSGFNYRAAQHAATKPWWREVDPRYVTIEVLGPDVRTREQAEDLENRYIGAECPQYNQIGNGGRYDAASALRAQARAGDGWWVLRDAVVVSWLGLVVRREARELREAVARLLVYSAVLGVFVAAVVYA